MNDIVNRFQGNRRIGIVLALFASAVFLSVIVRRWLDGGI